jgi:preprotein translocase subunit SecE
MKPKSLRTAAGLACKKGSQAAERGALTVPRLQKQTPIKAINTCFMERFKKYIAESWEEIRNKVSWTSYKELQSSAILVLVASFIFAIVIGAMDWVFNKSLEWFYREF